MLSYSYWNLESSPPDFKKGYDDFIRNLLTAAVLFEVSLNLGIMPLIFWIGPPPVAFSFVSSLTVLLTALLGVLHLTFVSVISFALLDVWGLLIPIGIVILGISLTVCFAWIPASGCSHEAWNGPWNRTNPLLDSVFLAGVVSSAILISLAAGPVAVEIVGIGEGQRSKGNRLYGNCLIAIGLLAWLVSFFWPYKFKD